MSTSTTSKEPLIQVEYNWHDQDPKDKPFAITNGGNDEARNIQIETLHIGRRSFTFVRVGQLLPGRSVKVEPEVDAGGGIVFRTIVDAIDKQSMTALRN